MNRQIADQSAPTTAASTYGSRTPTSAAAAAAAHGRLPGGHSRQTLVYRPYPFFAARGEGFSLYDLDGCRYLDLVNNYTSLIHGHAHPPTVAAIAAAAAAGSAPGTPTELELEMAEELARRIPSLERIRFAVTGSEAVGLALRVARAHTGRRRILKFEGGFHGIWDEVQQSIRSRPLAPGEFGPGQPNSAGLDADETIVARYNDLDSVRAALAQSGEEVAAVIAEPFLGNGALLAAAPGFLAALAELAHEHGALFVLDEIQSCRLAYGGAQSIHGVTPDLTTIGKTIGGGVPLAAFGGREELMATMDGADPAIPQPGTFNAFPLSLAAGLAALEHWREPDFERLNGLGESLRERTRAVFDAEGVPVSITGQGSMFHLAVAQRQIESYDDFWHGVDRPRENLHQELLARGVYLTPRGTGCLSTPIGDEQIDEWLAALEAALAATVAGAPEIVAA
jgi:glutamate-1-semialdehyde 2,1-aminomutase